MKIESVLPLDQANATHQRRTPEPRAVYSMSERRLAGCSDFQKMTGLLPPRGVPSNTPAGKTKVCPGFEFVDDDSNTKQQKG
jgi:hypothetical protein